MKEFLNRATIYPVNEIPEERKEQILQKIKEDLGKEGYSIADDCEDFDITGIRNNESPFKVSIKILKHCGIDEGIELLCKMKIANSIGNLHIFKLHIEKQQIKSFLIFYDRLIL